MELNYNCFCDCFMSDGLGTAYVYYEGKFCDEYIEGELYNHKSLTKEEYNNAFELVKAVNEAGGY